MLRFLATLVSFPAKVALDVTLGFRDCIDYIIAQINLFNSNQQAGDRPD